MIGNDVVDLKLAKAQSNWKRKGFLDKVYAPSEQIMISESIKQDLLIWRLWSMKESAYKAWLRLTKARKINPISFECQLINDYEGIVSCGAERYHTRTDFSDDFVHSFAFSADFDKELTGELIDVNMDRLSSEVFYNKVISALSQSKGWVEKDLSIIKNSHGIPELYGLKGEISVLCSLSHHGRFGSYLIAD